jgi:hypothetical protein
MVLLGIISALEVVDVLVLDATLTHQMRMTMRSASVHWVPVGMPSATVPLPPIHVQTTTLTKCELVAKVQCFINSGQKTSSLPILS